MENIFSIIISIKTRTITDKDTLRAVLLTHTQCKGFLILYSYLFLDFVPVVLTVKSWDEFNRKQPFSKLLSGVYSEMVFKCR